MPSVSRVLGFLGACFLAAAPSVSAQISLTYFNELETLTYNGNGLSSDYPLVGVIDELTQSSVSGAPHSSGAGKANFDQMFLLQNSWMGPGTKCCFAGYNQDNTVADCTIPSGNGGAGAISINSNTPIVAVDASGGAPYYVITCTSPTNPDPDYVYFQLRQFKASDAPAQGQLDWVAEAISKVTIVGTKETVVYQPTIQIPFVSHLTIAADDLFVDTTTVTTEPTVYVKMDNGLFQLASAQALNVAPVDGQVDSLATGTTTTSIVNGVSQVQALVGCIDPVLGTVNDATAWPVPAMGSKVVSYKPRCQFIAVGQQNGQDSLAQVVVSFNVHIQVMPPCHPVSGATYVFDDIKAALTQGKNAGGPVIYDLTQSPSVPLSWLKKTVYVDDNSPTASFPFLSFLSVADDSSVMKDPIGTYFAQASLGPAPTDDTDEPILCRERDWVVIGTDASTGKPIFGFAATEPNPVPLVNDLTQFAKGEHYIECGAWDNNGIYTYGLVQISVLTYVPPPTTQCKPTSTSCCVNGKKYLFSSGKCPCTKPGACGDPQFTGFLSQSYQVHGVSGQVYNVLSTPSFQYNALFSYLESGKCRAGTQCFSHPGNYFGEVGMLMKGSDASVRKVHVIAGPVDAGLRVLVDGVAMPVSSSSVQVGDATLTLASAFELQVETSEFSIRLSNSDMFINQDVAINTPLLKHIQQFKQASKSNNASAAESIASTLPHGLLGQTWQYKTYDNRWKYIQGTLFEYTVSDGVLGVDFRYNRF